MSIKEADLFSGVSQRVITKIGQNSEEENFKKGAIIFREGDPAGSFYVLGEGEVDIMAGKREVIHFTVGKPGEVFGWSALVEPYRYTATAQCSEDTKVIKISRDLVEQVIREHPEEGLMILKHLTGIIAQRLRYAYRTPPPEM